MLEHKGIPFKRVDLVTAMHKPSLKLLGFSGTTVPAMKADGRKVQGSREISRALDEIKPEPALLTSDAVREAERWGDEELQPDSAPARLVGAACTCPARSAPRPRACRCRATAWGCRSASRAGRCSRSRRWRPVTTTRPTKPCRRTSQALPGKIDQRRRAARRGRDRRRPAERRGLPDRDQRAAAPRLRGPQAVHRGPARPRTTPAGSCREYNARVPEGRSRPSGCHTSSARRLELGAHQRVPAAIGQHLPHAEQHARARRDRVARP